MKHRNKLSGQNAEFLNVTFLKGKIMLGVGLLA
jgi:hypothetical protein